MYLNNDFTNYKYLVSAHDNYVILSTRHNVIVSSGDSVNIPIIYNYLNDGSIIESSTTLYNSASFNDISSSFTNDYLELTSAPFYFICGSIIICFMIFIINNLTKLFKKGGAFGSN